MFVRLRAKNSVLQDTTGYVLEMFPVIDNCTVGLRQFRFLWYAIRAESSGEAFATPDSSLHILSVQYIITKKNQHSIHTKSIIHYLPTFAVSSRFRDNDLNSMLLIAESTEKARQRALTA